ncbi:MAG: SWIM zinc finger family protein [Calothrix sp. SM1_5_4]|nr:SWIM zinc finger family protein [Calothrix sp. SM1_5_4]
MMTLKNRFRNEFGPTCQERGTLYFQSGCVEVRDRHDGIHARFTVIGTELYGVSLEYDDKARVMRMGCSCPRFQAGDTCKHVWASLLKCDEERIFANLESESADIEAAWVLDDDLLFDPWDEPTATPLPFWMNRLDRAKKTQSRKLYP